MQCSLCKSSLCRAGHAQYAPPALCHITFFGTDIAYTQGMPLGETETRVQGLIDTLVQRTGTKFGQAMPSTRESQC